MEVIRARVCGYCMGVRRAVEAAAAEAARAATAGAEAAAAGGAADTVYTLGPLIHNPDALAMLRRSGVEQLPGDAPADLSGRTVVIRAHGVAPAVAAALAARGARVVDATCPRVRSSQRRAAAFAAEGYLVFLAGEPHHAELVGIAGFAPNHAIVASAAEAAAAAARAAWNGPTALIGQTTITRAEYAAIADVLRGAFPGIAIVDSVCSATEDRQAALAELGLNVDAIVVVGGRDSANTRRLAAMAAELGKPSWHVESAEELPPEAFGYARVGLSAGASTPDAVVDAVEARLLAGDCAD
jgi:4-hydroxy-3-methylbut-2-enyl diphosphate reductase